MNEPWQAAGADPQAVALGSHQDQHRALFPSSATEASLLDVEQSPFFFAGVCCSLIKGHRLPCLDRERSRGTHGQAESGTVA